MCTLLKLSRGLKSNNKVDFIKETNEITLSDEIELNKIVVSVKTNRNLVEWAKSLYIYKQGNKFKVKVYNINPTTTLLKTIYENCEVLTKYVEPKYAHENPFFEIVVSEKEINQIVNFLYSKNN